MCVVDQWLLLGLLSCFDIYGVPISVDEKERKEGGREGRGREEGGRGGGGGGGERREQGRVLRYAGVLWVPED